MRLISWDLKDDAVSCAPDAGLALCRTEPLRDECQRQRTERYPAARARVANRACTVLVTRATNLPEAPPPLLGAETSIFLALCAAIVAFNASRPFDGLSIREALCEIGVGNEEAASLLPRQRSDLKREISQLADGSASIDQSMNLRT